jgi:Fe-S cluster biosynthesis and repair protein YggX
MMNLEHRKLLEEQMQQFLFEGQDVTVEGYVPQNKA